MTQPAAQLAAQPLADVLTGLAARTPVPGGGAAAAIAAALGCAAGAMAARYSTGPRYPDSNADAEALVASLDAAVRVCTALGDADAAAYAALRARPHDATAQAESAAVPSRLLTTCVQAAEALVRFLPRCNPRLHSDVRVGVFLLAGAGRAAAATLDANPITPAQRAAAGAELARLAAAERGLDVGTTP